MISKDELAAMIAALESQAHLSMKEEKYLSIMKELRALRKQYDEDTNSNCFGG